MRDVCFSIMYKTENCVDISVVNNIVSATWHKNSFPLPILGNGTYPLTPKHIMEYLTSRCFDASRKDKEILLSELGLSSYDPIEITRITEGRMHTDTFWVKYHSFL